MKKSTFLVTVFLFCLNVLVCKVWASGNSPQCVGSFFNIIEEVNWYGVFPIEFAGVELAPSYDDPASLGLDRPPGKLDQIVCLCKEKGKIRIGLSVSFWSPARLVETVRVPLCFPALGGIKLDVTNMNAKWKYKSSGVSPVRGKSDVKYSSNYNVHYYFFDPLTIIGIFLDLPCPPKEGFDLLEISEVDPEWDNDIIANIINPEAVLFANLPAQLACIADSATSSFTYPVDYLFWCVGQWGGTYPMSAESNSHNSIQGSALSLARMLYRNARIGYYLDPGVDICNLVYTPVLIKSNNKVHLARPRKGPLIPLGRTQLLWDSLKNPPFGSKKSNEDHYVWVLFRRVKCCFGPVF